MVHNKNALYKNVICAVHFWKCAWCLDMWYIHNTQLELNIKFIYIYIYITSY